MSLLKALNKGFVGITVLAFIAVAVLALNLSMQEEGHNMLPGCPYKTWQEAMCPMNLVDHLTYWKQTFTGDHAAAVQIVLILLFVPLILFVLKELFIHYFPRIRELKIFENKNKYFKLFNWLLLALGRGILQPKIYASATVLV